MSGEKVRSGDTIRMGTIGVSGPMPTFAFTDAKRDRLTDGRWRWLDLRERRAFNLLMGHRGPREEQIADEDLVAAAGPPPLPNQTLATGYHFENACPDCESIERLARRAGAQKWGPCLRHWHLQRERRQRWAARAALAAVLALVAVILLASGCGEITTDSAPDGLVRGRSDVGPPAGTGGAAGAGGGASGIGGALAPGAGGAGLAGAPGAGGEAAAQAGAGGAAGDLPLCPTTGAPEHDTPCAKDSVCGQRYAPNRCAICNTGPYPPGYDLSVLPCQGAYRCVASCEL